MHQPQQQSKSDLDEIRLFHLLLNHNNMSLPSPPFITVPGIANFRDVGDDVTIRRGLLFRSADPTRATEEGLQKMSKSLAIKHIFDLRSAPEIQRDGPEWADVPADASDPFAAHGMQRHWVPVFAAQDYGPEQVAVRYVNYTHSGTEGFVQAYRDILGAAPEAYTAILKQLVKGEGEACLIHCTAGKDRTGVLVALLSLLAGREKEAICDEYALTDLGLAHLKGEFKERLLRNPALEGNPEGVDRMISSKKENMEATIEMIGKEFGGAEGYMRKYCGLSDEEIERLRRNLKVKA